MHPFFFSPLVHFSVLYIDIDSFASYLFIYSSSGLMNTANYIHCCVASELHFYDWSLFLSTS